MVGPEPMTSVGNTHQIPYTPFTAFIPRQNTYNTEALSDAPRAHLLDETDDSLARLYNQLLRFVERDLCRIMTLGDKIAVATHTESRMAKGDDTPVEVEETRGFQIMSHVVWEELGKSLMDEIGVVVFAAGSPKEFRQVRLRRFLVSEILKAFYSTMRRHKHLFVRWNFLHLPVVQSNKCVNIRYILPLNVGGSYLYISNCDGRK